jgi:hypothetical protein
MCELLGQMSAAENETMINIILGTAMALAITSPGHAAEELVDVTKNPGWG